MSNELKYTGSSIFIETVNNGSVVSYEYEVYSNFDDAYYGGGFADSIEKIKAQFKGLGDKFYWHTSGLEIQA